MSTLFIVIQITCSAAVLAGGLLYSETRYTGAKERQLAKMGRILIWQARVGIASLFLLVPNVIVWEPLPLPNIIFLAILLPWQVAIRTRQSAEEKNLKKIVEAEPHIKIPIPELQTEIRLVIQNDPPLRLETGHSPWIFPAFMLNEKNKSLLQEAVIHSKEEFIKTLRNKLQEMRDAGATHPLDIEYLEILPDIKTCFESAMLE